MPVLTHKQRMKKMKNKINASVKARGNEDVGPELAAPSSGMPVHLDLGSGETPAPGFDGVDLYAPSAKYKVNLMRFPWTDLNTGKIIPRNSVDELHCSHFIEHLPANMTAPDGSWVDPSLCLPEHKHMFFRWFEEAWAVLKMGGVMTIYVPSARHHRAFQDPTHTSFYVPERFCYLMAPWRAMNKLEHAYNTDVNFEVVSCDPMGDHSLTLLHEEVRNRKFMESWNVITDYKAVLRKATWTPPAAT